MTFLDASSSPLTIESLKAQNLILLECVSGSHAYGLATKHSDVDIKGVFYLPRSRFFAMTGVAQDYVAQVNDVTNDTVYYELGRYVELLLASNPNILELLATPSDCVRYQHPLMMQFLPQWFISQQCQKSFAGFAQSQIKKARGLNKKIVNPMDKTKKSILEFCVVLDKNHSIAVLDWLAQQSFSQQQLGLVAMPNATQMYAMYVDTSGQQGFSGLIQKPDTTSLSLSSIPKGMIPIAYLSFNQQGFSKYCRDYQAYWQWVEERNESRYQATLEHGKKYDAKNMMHTIRLLQMAVEIAEIGQVKVRRDNREALLAIKSGSHDYDELLALAEQLGQRAQTAFANSTLPQYPNHGAAIAALTAVRTALYTS